MKKVCFLLPTNDPTTIKKYLLPTLENLKNIAEDICFAINFQKPYTDEEINEILAQFEKLNIETKYKFSTYNIARAGLIPFNKIRYDCATLYPDIKYYALCDDDFVFCEDSDLMIEDIIYKFETNANIGLIQCDKKPAFIPFGYTKREPKFHNYYTSSGYFFRNINDTVNNVLVFPQEALELIGAGEEYVIGLELAHNGYDIFVRTRSTILHCRELDECNNSPYGWGNPEIVNNHLGNMGFIKNKYKEILNNVKNIRNS